ncbi:DUF6980 family protein [Dyadobacter sp. CY323]|uniref:DUF6980 family protein n=1 Tax=Dyadobacter sp. CY323 TaxID=2907302 RepID=UPI001F2BF9BD|nr:hypothetical protein [Dyadobacter sp. CY323]MCE6992052.1 hypothetical protein [Dyadobacter sp. CY323]
MKLTLFKKYFKTFNDLPLPGDVWQTAEYEAYVEAIGLNKDCGDWYFKQKIKDAGINYKKYCCLKMAYHLIEDKKATLENPINYDSVITHKRIDFGLPIHDGGNSYIKIDFCPWCGKKLSVT